MRLAIYEGSITIFDISGIGLMYKYGLVLADAVFYGGMTMTLHSLMYMAPRLPLEQKVKMLKSFDKKDYNDDRLEYDLMLKFLKAQKKIKHKPTAFLQQSKKLEITINNYFNAVLKEYDENLDRAGLPSYNGAMTTSGFMRGYIINHENNELEDEIYMSLSNVLNGMPEQDQERPDIPFLPIEFLNKEYGLKDKTVYGMDDEAALDHQNPWLYHCFTVPHLLLATESEVLLLRSQLDYATRPFRQAMDQWSDMCVNEDDTTVRLSFFKEQILPHIQSIKDHLANNQIIQKRQSSEFEMYDVKILIGEVPVSVIFNFYHQSGTLQDKTWNVLQKWLAEEDEMQTRWPVMVMEITEQFKADLKHQKEDEVLENAPLQPKKFISIDD